MNHDPAKVKVRLMSHILHPIGALMLAGVILLAGPGPVQTQAQTEHPEGEKKTTLGPETPSGPPPVTLDELLEEALERNPALQAAKRAVLAKEASISPAKTLPDPTVTFQTMGDPAPARLQTGDPSSARTFGIQQEIPFPGKLGLKAKIAGKEAEAELWNYEQTKRQVIADLKQAYYDLYLIDESIETVEKDKTLLEGFARIAEAKYRVGLGIQQDVLKAQVEVSKLVDRATLLEQRRGATVALINSLVYRPPGTPLGKVARVEKAALSRSLEELQQLAREQYPMLKRQEREVDRSRFEVDLARKEFYPDFSAGFTYFDRDGMPGMYAYMVGAKVPLYFWRKQRPALEGARTSLAAAQKQRDSTEAAMYAKVEEAYLAARAADKLFVLYTTGIIPQSKLSLESAVAGYQVGKVDFLTLLDSLLTLLEYELKYYEVLTQFQKALAQLEVLAGIELTR